MIANALRVEIEAYAASMRRTNALFSRAEDGSFTPSCMVTYLTNVRYLIARTSFFLSRARDRARDLGDARLALHYEEKRVEELGHEKWADGDIANLTDGVLSPARADVVPAVHELVRFLTETIDEDPPLYLSYILFVEYLTVLLGPEWLLLLEQRCGIPRSSMTVIGNHVEADQGHVEEALDRIDALVGEPDKLPRMREILIQSMRHFDRLCAQVTLDPARESRTSHAEHRVSAA